MTERLYPKAPTREGFQLPSGLIILLVLYAVPVGIYLYLSSHSSPEYLAARHDAVAQALIGHDSGRHLNNSELNEAYAELVAAARQRPQVRKFHDDMETLNTRFAERGLRPAPDLVAQANAVGALYRQAHPEGSSFLGSSEAEGSWDTDEVLGQFRKGLLFATLGLGAILLFWGYGQYRLRTDRLLMRDVEIDRVEDEVEALGAFRRVVPDLETTKVGPPPAPPED